MYGIITGWDRSGDDGGAWLAHHKMRYNVFSDRMGYDTLAHRGLESDQYDNPLADYAVVMHDGRAVACCRLVSTEHPIMLRDIWPEMLGDFDTHQPGLIEATRIGAVNDGSLTPQERRDAFELLLSLILGWASWKGKTGIIGIMVERAFKASLERRGCVTTYLAPAIDIDGHKTIAGHVDVSASLHKRWGKGIDHVYAFAPNFCAYLE
jgi:acyl homoserine lactone synthase